MTHFPRTHITHRADAPALVLVLVLGIAPAQVTIAHSVAVAAPSCSSCHISSEPTPERPSLRPCARPGHRAPLQKPNTIAEFFIIDALTDLYVPVVFPHRLHGDMTEMGIGCAQCHHHTERDAIVGCVHCHPVSGDDADLTKPTLKGAYHRQCLGCHREWSHENQCSVCHAKRKGGDIPPPPPDATDVAHQLHPRIEIPDTKIYRLDADEDMAVVTFHHRRHANLYSVKCATCHRSWDCTECHEAGHSRHIQNPDWDYHEECSRCHEAQVDDNCAFCHDQAPREPPTHKQRTGFALKAYHQELACSRCHPEPGAFTDLAQTCDSCHVDKWPPTSFDHAILGVVFDEDHTDLECTDCHANGIGKKLSCDECHDDKPTALPAP